MCGAGPPLDLPSPSRQRLHREGYVVRRAAVAAAFLVLGVTWALAQTYPSRPVKVVVPFPAGGGTDALTRFVTKGMEQRLGQPLIIGYVLAGVLVARAHSFRHVAG